MGNKTSFPKICFTYPTMMKLSTVIPYLKKIKKTYESRVTHLLTSADNNIFSPEMLYNLYQEVQIHIAFWYIITNCLGKTKSLGLLKIKVFWNKGYDVVASIHDVTNKILSCGSSFIVDVVILTLLWEKLSWPQF